MLKIITLSDKEVACLREEANFVFESGDDNAIAKQGWALATLINYIIDTKTPETRKEEH